MMNSLISSLICLHQICHAQGLAQGGSTQLFQSALSEGASSQAKLLATLLIAFVQQQPPAKSSDFVSQLRTSRRDAIKKVALVGALPVLSIDAAQASDQVPAATPRLTAKQQEVLRNKEKEMLLRQRLGEYAEEQESPKLKVCKNYPSAKACQKSAKATNSKTAAATPSKSKQAQTAPLPKTTMNEATVRAASTATTTPTNNLKRKEATPRVSSGKVSTAQAATPKVAPAKTRAAKSSPDTATPAKVSGTKKPSTRKVTPTMLSKVKTAKPKEAPGKVSGIKVSTKAAPVEAKRPKAVAKPTPPAKLAKAAPQKSTDVGAPLGANVANTRAASKRVVAKPTPVVKKVQDAANTKRNAAKVVPKKVVRASNARVQRRKPRADRKKTNNGGLGLGPIAAAAAGFYFLTKDDVEGAGSVGKDVKSTPFVNVGTDMESAPAVKTGLNATGTGKKRAFVRRQLGKMRNLIR